MVIFMKNNKEYKLTINNTKTSKIEYTIIPTQIEQQNITKEDDKLIVKRDLVNSYIQNFGKIWDNISINEIKTKTGIDGFKINSVKKGSIFEKLGLKKGDIIKEVNNIKLKSYNDAFIVYRKIDKIKNINIVVLRNGLEEELNYEIK